MTKKGIIYAIAAVLFLALCYVIGQTVVGPKTIGDEQTVYYDYTDKSTELVYTGKEDSEVPGGSSVGLVEDEIYGKYYLMTPDTVIRAGIILDKKPHTLTFTYMIHKNVAELSDGMKLHIVVTQVGTENVLYDDTVEVRTDEKEYELNLESWEGQNVYITFMADNDTEDRNGDWMVIKDAKIE